MPGPRATPPPLERTSSARMASAGAEALLVAAIVTGGWAWRPAAAADAVLDTAVTATWSGIGLRDWAARVSDTAAVAVIVDPRLDPDTLVRLDCREQPLRDVLARVAAVAGADVVPLRSSIRLAPRGTATTLARAEEARRAAIAALPPRHRAPLEARGPASWPAGATPRDLIAGAVEGRAAVEGLERVPHDHLPATSLPPLTLAERLDLLLAPFDLRIDWTPGAGDVEFARRPLPTGRIVDIGAGLPAGGPPLPGKTAGRRPSARPTPAGEVRFTLRVAAPLEELLATVAARLGVTLDLDRPSLAARGIAPGEIVRTTVQNASRDELLAAILEPLGLRWTIADGRLRVFAAD